jgi:DNA-directed RNA polymerase subunit H (RpoH/RPB5)
MVVATIIIMSLALLFCIWNIWNLKWELNFQIGEKLHYQKMGKTHYDNWNEVCQNFSEFEKEFHILNEKNFDLIIELENLKNKDLPKFKIGDRVQLKNKTGDYIISNIKGDQVTLMKDIYYSIENVNIFVIEPYKSQYSED